MAEGDGKPRKTLLERLDPALEVTAARELGVALCEAVLARGGKAHGGLWPGGVTLEKGGLVIGEAGDGGGGAEKYLAPERGGERRLDGRADVYSIGAILYRALLGAPPYEKPPEELPAELRPIVMRCLHREPERRYQDVRGLLTALGGGKAAETEKAGAATEQAGVPRGRRRWVVMLLASLLVVGALGAGGWWWWKRKHENTSPSPSPSTSTSTSPSTSTSTSTDAGATDAADAETSATLAPDASIPPVIARPKAGPGIVIAAVEVTGDLAGPAAGLRAALAERLREHGVDVLEGSGLQPMMAPSPDVIEVTLQVAAAPAGLAAGLQVDVRVAGAATGTTSTVTPGDCESGVETLAALIVKATRLGSELPAPPRAGVALAAWQALVEARVLAESWDDPAAEAAFAIVAKRADAPLLALAELALVRRRLGLTGLSDEALRQLDKRGKAGAWLTARLGPARAGFDDAAADAATAAWPLDLELARARVRALAAAGRLEDMAAEIDRARSLDDARRWPDLESIELAMGRGGPGQAAAIEAIAASPGQARASMLLEVAELALELGEVGPVRALLAAARVAPGADAGTTARADALAVWLDHLGKRSCEHPVAEIVRIDLRKDLPLAHARRLAELTVALTLACGDRFEVKAALARHRAQASRDRLLSELEATLALDLGDFKRARQLLGKAADAAVTGSPRRDRARRQGLLLGIAAAGGDVAAALRTLGPPRAGDRLGFPYAPLLLAVGDAQLQGGAVEDAIMAYQEVRAAAPARSIAALAARIGLARAHARTDRPAAEAELRALVRELENADDDFPPARSARRTLRETINQR